MKLGVIRLFNTKPERYLNNLFILHFLTSMLIQTKPIHYAHKYHLLIYATRVRGENVELSDYKYS